MLILTRKVGEAVMIGEDIAITVLRVKGNQVRLGVEAPKRVSVQREEIHQRMQNEAAPAAAAELAADGPDLTRANGG